MRNKIVIRYEYGQLGNILFRLANTLAYALEYGHKVEDYTLAFCNYHDGSSNIKFFKNYHPFHFFQYPCPKFRFINRLKWKFRKHELCKVKKIENFTPYFDLSQLSPIVSYELKGFHFSTKNLVVKHRQKICQILEFRRSLKKPMDSIIKKARSEFSLLLGIHIRHNDFKEFYNGKYFVQLDKYSKIINQFKKFNYANNLIGVIVCSDCPEVLRQINQRYPSYITPKGTVAQDMYALSKCDFLVGPKASTYSPWASFIGKIPIFQIDYNSQLNCMSSFKLIKQLESLNLT